MSESSSGRAKAIGVVAFGAIVFFLIISHGKAPGGGASGHCRVRLESEPAGASLFINGRLVGATPLTVDGLARGEYGVRLEKDGWETRTRTLSITDPTAVVKEKLEELPTGAIQVDVKPNDAEVLLNGELVGYTPLKLDRVAAGSYELLIRKTNFDSYSTRIDVAPGAPLAFTGFELNDKIFAMMDGLIKSEPQRLAHYIDLGHYLFVNDKIDASVDIYTQGMEVMRSPLNFDGPGYAGEKNMPPDEIQLEKRLRTEDEARYTKELDKHRAWQRTDSVSFRTKLEEAQEQIARKNIASWEWAARSAQLSIQGRNYEKAKKVYIDHIAVVAPGSKDLPQAYVALIEVDLMQRDVPNAAETFDKFYELYQADGAALRLCGQNIYVYNDRMRREKDRARVLEMAEKALRRGVELSTEPFVKSQGLFDLGTVLMFQGQYKLAISVFEQSIEFTADKAVKEERSLRLADALRKSGKLAEARSSYEKLKKSDRTSIRESAETGLNFIGVEENRKK